MKQTLFFDPPDVWQGLKTMQSYWTEPGTLLAWLSLTWEAFVVPQSGFHEVSILVHTFKKWLLSWEVTVRLEMQIIVTKHCSREISIIWNLSKSEFCGWRDMLVHQSIVTWTLMLYICVYVLIIKFYCRTSNLNNLFFWTSCWCLLISVSILAKRSYFLHLYLTRNVALHYIYTYTYRKYFLNSACSQSFFFFFFKLVDEEGGDSTTDHQKGALLRHR